jgi:hypothetical protein
MPSEQINAGETTLDLCYLMRDLEVLGGELLIAEDTEGHHLNGTLQLPLTDRLIRVGLDAHKVESFHAWRQTLAGLAGSTARDEDQLAKVATAEQGGLILLADLIADLRTHNRQIDGRDLEINVLAA